MERGRRLFSGARVGVVGAGVAGAGLAASLLFNARARGLALDVRVFDGAAEGRVPAPALLTPECRSRLAALGCRLPAEWRTLELRGVEVLADGRRELLPCAAGALWVVDAWPHGPAGLTQVRDALLQAASTQGARVVSRRVERVERQPAAPDAPAAVRAQGPLVVRGQGAGERFHAVALAAGAAGAALGDAFFPGFAPPRTLAAVEARLRTAGPRLPFAPLARLWLAPIPALDGLLLVPTHHGVYALGFGQDASPADLCQALMMAARDGYLDESFEIATLAPTRLPLGAGGRRVGPGQLAVGAAAFGHPLQLGIADTLASCSRAAVGLLEAGLEPGPLERRYVRDGLGELDEQARAGAAALPWLRRAGARGPEAFAAALRQGAPRGGAGGGVLGLQTPTPRALLRRARWAAVREVVSSWVRTPFEPLPPSIPSLEGDLYYVVDDDDAAREAMTQMLEATGAKVVAFADELALYCAVARRPPTAILLDVVLHWVDGLRLCEELKRHPLTRPTRVIVMSGLDRPHVRARALAAGAEAFLPKPVDPSRLLRLLAGREALPGASDAAVELAAAGDADRYAS